MTIPRMVGVLISLTVIGIAVVVVRVDQAATLRRIQELQFRQTDLHREIWTQELELARLRCPRMLRERAERFGLTVGSGESGPGQTVKREN